MIGRRDLLRMGAMAPAFLRSAASRGDGPNPPYCSPGSRPNLVRPGRRIAAESVRDWTPFIRAYDAIQQAGARSPATLADQQDIHSFYSGTGAGFNVHGDATIFLWHRWFLYFHERLLTRAAGVPITVPYWDGCLDPMLPLPPVLSKPPLIPQGGACTEHQSGPATQAQAVIANLKSRTNLDAAYDGATQWHSDVHNLAPMDLRRPCLLYDMHTAAGDPLFYFFHAQFDRIFDWWRKIPGNTIAKVHLDRVFYFYDFPPKGEGEPVCVNVRAGDALHLEYTYDDPIPRPRKGSIAPTGYGPSKAANTLEIQAVDLIPGVTQYQVVLQCGGNSTTLGLYNVLAHHTPPKGKWQGRAIYIIPEACDPTHQNVVAELVPVTGHGGRVRLAEGDFSIQMRQVLE